MTITDLLAKLPPRAVDSLAEIARSSLESATDEHLVILNREHRNVQPILSNTEFYWYQEVVRSIVNDETAMEVLLYDSSGHR